MATQNTEDQVREQKIAKMGKALGELHFLLWKEITWLHLEWQQYREIFATSESRIQILNRSAPRFFWSLDRVLWQDILLSLSRLSDPPGTGGQQNLTFRRLLPLVADSALRDSLTNAMDDYAGKAQFARDWRHRRFAHRALDHVANPTASPLATASRAHVEEALGSARQLMNLLEGHYQDSETAYEYSTDSGGGPRELLYFLDAGLQAEEKRRRDGGRRNITFE